MLVMILDIVLDLSNLFDDVWYILIITANNQVQKMVITNQCHCAFCKCVIADFFVRVYAIIQILINNNNKNQYNVMDSKIKIK